MHEWDLKALQLFVSPSRREPGMPVMEVDSLASFLRLIGGGAGGTLYGFSRRNLPYYLLARFLFATVFARRRLSVVYDFRFDEAGIYCMKLKDALPFQAAHPARRASRLKSLLKFYCSDLRARYLVVDHDQTGVVTGSMNGRVVTYRCGSLFFTNIRGKLLFRADCSPPVILKTTNAKGYAAVVEKEFRCMEWLNGQSAEALVPATLGRLECFPGRDFFLEEYVESRNLRELLEELAIGKNLEEALRWLSSMDRWFAGYERSFGGELLPLVAVYREPLKVFSELFSAREETAALVSSLNQRLCALSLQVWGLRSVISHGDLWPANFLVREGSCLVIDWERSRPGGATLFDYYWMMISSALVYLRSCHGCRDYAEAFRIYLEQSEHFGRTAKANIVRHLEQNGIGEAHYPLFLLLFFVELSVQGFLSYGYSTDMDLLVHGQLLEYLSGHPEFLRPPAVTV